MSLSSVQAVASLGTRKFKNRGRLRLLKTPQSNNIIGLKRKNNYAASEARILAHIFAVFCVTTTWNHQICGFYNNVVQLETSGTQFIFRVLRPQLYDVKEMQ